MAYLTESASSGTTVHFQSGSFGIGSGRSSRFKTLFGGALCALGLLVGRAVVLEPTWRMTIGRVSMCPVNNAALGVPFILASEGHHVAFAKSHDPWCDVYVVRDKKRLTRLKRHDKALVS